MHGTWTVKICDDASGGSGTYNSSSLVFKDGIRGTLGGGSLPNGMAPWFGHTLGLTYEAGQGE